MLEASHQVEFDGALISLVLAEGQPADAMLRRDRPAKRHDDVVDDPVHFGALCPVALRRPVGRPYRIVVQVAVADMAERAVTDAWVGTLHGGIRGLQEFGNLRHRDRYVVGDRAAGPSLRLGEVLPHLAEPLRLRSRRGDYGIAHKARLHG